MSHRAAAYGPIAGVLLLAFGWLLLAPSVVVLSFHLDRAEIIRTLCVERSKPQEQNGCKGSCHLEKQLKAVQPQDEGEEPPPRLERMEVIAVMNASDNSSSHHVERRLFPHGPSPLLAGAGAAPDPVPRGA